MLKFFLIPLLSCLILLAGIIFSTESGCTTSGVGHWSTSRYRCVTRLCYDFSSCPPSVANTNKCQQISPGISERELFFQLGQPYQIDDTKLYFSSSKGFGENIEAEVENGTVIALDCKKDNNRIQKDKQQ